MGFRMIIESHHLIIDQLYFLFLPSWNHLLLHFVVLHYQFSPSLFMLFFLHIRRLVGLSHLNFLLTLWWCPFLFEMLRFGQSSEVFMNDCFMRSFKIIWRFMNPKTLIFLKRFLYNRRFMHWFLFFALSWLLVLSLRNSDLFLSLLLKNIMILQFWCFLLLYQRILNLIFHRI